MKKIFSTRINFLIVFLLMAIFSEKMFSQNSSFHKGELKTDGRSYKVIGQYDTTFSKNIEIIFLDTLVQSINVKFSKKLLQQYQLLKDTTYQFSNLAYNSSLDPMYAYKKDANTVIIVLGYLSSFNKHDVRIHIIGLKPNDTIDFETEF